jgi:hypothetical protein
MGLNPHLSIVGDCVRKLGKFLLILIHEYSSKDVITHTHTHTYIYIYSFLLPINKTRKPVKKKNAKIYLAEGPVPEAPAAPFPLFMMGCSM